MNKRQDGGENFEKYQGEEGEAQADYYRKINMNSIHDDSTDYLSRNSDKILSAMPSDTFCTLPWIHVNSTVSGLYRPCCNSNARFQFDGKDTDVRVHLKSFKEVFYGEDMNRIRQQMLNNERPPECSVCYNNEDAGLSSYRQDYNRRENKFLPLVEKDLTPKLKYLDIKFDNKCNLQCRMCDPGSSDQHWEGIEYYVQNNLEFSDHMKPMTTFFRHDKDNVLGRLEDINKMKNRKYYQDLKNKYISDNLNDVSILKVTGGEPFISKDFLEILDLAIEKNYAKNIHLSITTNGSKFIKKYLEKFTFFKTVDFNISIDGTEKIYDYIRYPFSWNNINERLNGLLTFIEDYKLTGKIRARLSCLVQAYNWLNLGDIDFYFEELSSKYSWLDLNGLDYNFNLFPEKSELHAKYLPKHLLELGVENFLKMAPLNRQVKDIEHFAQKYLKIDDEEHKQKRLKQMTVTYDKMRKQQYNDYMPKEFNTWLDGIKI